MIPFRNLARKISNSKPAGCSPGQTILPWLVAALSAILVTGCANLVLLSDKELQEAISTDVKRKTLKELDPQISDHYRRFYGDRFSNPNLTFVPDVLLGNLIARTKGPAFVVAAAWNVPAVLGCRFPSLTRPILDRLSHGDSYVILLSSSFVDSALGTQDKLILVHEILHSIQYQRDRLLSGRDCSQPSTLEEYIRLPEEQEAFAAEIRYAQTALKMTWERYLYSRFGMQMISNRYFQETIKRLWDEVESDQGKSAEKSSSAQMCPPLRS